jgi:hypothetical protein
MNPQSSYYIVRFVVQADSPEEALEQAEAYLNIGPRVIDCDVVGKAIPDTYLPRPAPYLRLR